MKLIRFGEKGNEKPGVLVDDRIIDLSARYPDWNTEFFARGGLSRLRHLNLEKATSLKLTGNIRLGSPIARPGKIVCIGLNFHDHAREAGLSVPDYPPIFFKGANTISGPNDDLLIPLDGDQPAKKTDWEIELGVVIGTEARYLKSPDDAINAIAGYLIANDVSERKFQMERSGGQWSKGKNCDSFCPIGPWLVTADEIEPGDLGMRLWHNGVLRQNGTTADMICSVAECIHHLSQYMTLEPGDLVLTGTPFGVGMGLNPPRFLREGDELVLEIDGLGQQKYRCRNDA